MTNPVQTGLTAKPTLCHSMHAGMALRAYRRCSQTPGGCEKPRKVGHCLYLAPSLISSLLPFSILPFINWVR